MRGVASITYSSINKLHGGLAAVWLGNRPAQPHPGADQSHEAVGAHGQDD